jgi:hypothetical protein
MGGRGSSSGGGSGKLTSVASIASRLIALPGGNKDPVRMARVREGLKAGKDLGTVQLSRLPNGKLFVEQGRHRLFAARELGIPIRVKITKAHASAEVGTVPLF